MFHRIHAHAVVALGLVVASALPLPAVSATPSTGKRPPTSVRFIDAPSSESPAARKKRLQKECKGRPNAGACLGMTGRG